MPTPPATQAQAEGLDAISRLNHDLTEAAKSLSATEARYFADLYYQMQDQRIRAAGQIRSMAETDEPNLVLAWYLAHSERLETEVRKALDKYSMAHPVGVWMRAIKGVGPVIAAGLLAHIDIERAPTAGHIWSFAGLNPEAQWNKGEKRPFNARLKVLCWKLGESFVKVSGRDDAPYGRIYAERKALETQRNDAGQFAAQAADKLARYKIGKTTDAYKCYAAGKLPPAHIHARAKRYAVKLFLSHLHGYWYEQHFHRPAPLPYPIAILGHAHLIEA